MDLNNIDMNLEESNEQEGQNRPYSYTNSKVSESLLSAMNSMSNIEDEISVSPGQSFYRGYSWNDEELNEIKNFQNEHRKAIREQIKRFGGFKNPHNEKKFRHFIIQSVPFYYSIILGAIVTITFVLIWTLIFHEIQTKRFFIGFIVSLVLTNVPIWILSYYKLTKKLSYLESFKLYTILECCSYLGIIISACIILIARIRQGPCNDNNFPHIWICLPAKNTIPADIAFTVIISPFALTLIFPYLPNIIVIIGHAISLGCIIYGLADLRSINSIPWIILILVLVYFCQFFFYMQYLELFSTTNKFYEIVESNSKRQIEESQKLATTIKSMITSIVHDIKSPLAASICGLDVLKLSIIELETKLETKYKNKKFVKNFDGIASTLESIYGSYQILVMTINRCTEYVKTSQNVQLVPQKEIVNLNETINLPLNYAREVQKKINVKLYYDSRISVYIITDRQWLLDNLLCLLSNAIKYSSEGDVFLKVEITKSNEMLTTNSPKFKPPQAINEEVKIPDDYYQDHVTNEQSDEERYMLLFSVGDTGMGIKEEERALIFKPPDFTRHRPMGGTGLGLYCLAERIKALGGTYGVSNMKGKQGSLFWFTIPYIQASHSMNAQVNGQTSNKNQQNLINIPAQDSSFFLQYSALNEWKASASGESIVSDLSLSHDNDSSEVGLHASRRSSLDLSKVEKDVIIPNMSILVVDDSLPILKVLKMMLEKNGQKVDTACNGKEALKLMGLITNNDSDTIEFNPKLKQKYDVIIMDLQMPVMDGFDAMRNIRQYELEMEKSYTRECANIELINKFKTQEPKFYDKNPHMQKKSKSFITSRRTSLSPRTRKSLRNKSLSLSLNNAIFATHNLKLSSSPQTEDLNFSNIYNDPFDFPNYPSNFTRSSFFGKNIMFGGDKYNFYQNKQNEKNINSEPPLSILVHKPKLEKKSSKQIVEDSIIAYNDDLSKIQNHYINNSFNSNNIQKNIEKSLPKPQVQVFQPSQLQTQSELTSKTSSEQAKLQQMQEVSQRQPQIHGPTQSESKTHSESKTQLDSKTQLQSQPSNTPTGRESIIHPNRLNKKNDVPMHHLIIAMSANIDPSVSEQAYACGADFFFPKPFRIECLYKAVRITQEVTDFKNFKEMFNSP